MLSHYVPSVPPPVLEFPILDKEDLAKLFDADDPSCPFYGYHGNRAAVDTVLDEVYPAFTKLVQNGTSPYCPRCYPGRLLVNGPKSAGKTEFARRLGKLLGTPFLEIDCTKIRGAADVVRMLWVACQDHTPPVPIVPLRIVSHTCYYYPPPCLLFLDEIAELGKKRQGDFLKMLESDDHILQLDNSFYDFGRVGIVAATTDPGLLRDTIRDRFVSIYLQSHSVSEVAAILKDRWPDWLPEDCHKIARLRPTVRSARDFCHQVQKATQNRGREPLSVSQAIEVVAARLGINADGLSKRALAVLELLAEHEGGLSRESLCAYLGVAKEEFVNDILPPLLSPEDRPPLIEVTNRHHITPMGREYLRTCGTLQPFH